MEANFSLPTLSRAIETRDSATIGGLYADRAQLRIIDRDHPPSRPKEYVGRAAIAAYFDDVCGRTMTHKVESSFIDGDNLAYTQACAYPNGGRVFVSATAKLAAGKITNQTLVQAWDA